MRLPYRVGQALYYLTSTHRSAPAIPPAADALLNEPMRQQFRLLSAGDQRHLLRVYRYLVFHGADEDTMTAGLIHDVGKACRACRIMLLDRTLHVLLGRYLPGPYRWFASRDEPPRLLMGLHRLANHASRGARAAELAGYNPRVCSLVRDHEVGGDPEDAALRLLRLADTSADHAWDTDNR
jgi:hypothetical protein